MNSTIKTQLEVDQNDDHDNLDVFDLTSTQ